MICDKSYKLSHGNSNNFNKHLVSKKHTEAVKDSRKPRKSGHSSDSENDDGNIDLKGLLKSYHLRGGSPDLMDKRAKKSRNN